MKYLPYVFQFHLDPQMFKAVFSQTTRGKEQLLFCGQPFIYEKSIRLPNGQMKKLWRCNQWCVSYIFRLHFFAYQIFAIKTLSQ